MRARYDGSKWVVDVTAQQFEERVREFFRKQPYPTSAKLKRALVPNGVPNTARPGRFGVDGIYKFVFYSSDGILLMVKYHGPDSRIAAKFPSCTAATGWTAQILCNLCTFFTWDASSNKAGRVTVSVREAQGGLAPMSDAAHIPIRQSA